MAMAAPATTKKVVKIEVNDTMMIILCLRLNLILEETVAVEVGGNT